MGNRNSSGGGRRQSQGFRNPALVSQEGVKGGLGVHPDQEQQAFSLLKQGRTEEAIPLLRKLIATGKGSSGAHVNLAVALLRKGAADDAVELLHRALVLNPNESRAHFNLGNALRSQGELDAAMDSFRRALALQSHFPQALCSLGAILWEKGDGQAAVEHFRRALALDPHLPEAHCNLGYAHQLLGDIDAAIAAFRQALLHRPAYPDALSNLGNALQEQGRHQDAIAAFQQSVSLNPNNPLARSNLALALLHVGDFCRGWQHYESRWKLPGHQVDVLPTTRPSWSPGSGGRVLAWGEQGVGDEIMFASQIPHLHLLCDELTVRTDGRLIPLFRRSFPVDIRWLAKSQPISEEPFDSHIAMGSVGRFLRRKPAAFSSSAGGYLQTDLVRTQSIRSRLLGGGQQQLVGVSWRSSVKRSRGRDKSLPLHELATALAAKDMRLINLQYGDTAAEVEALRDHQGISVSTLADLDLFHDIDGLAALIEACDAVVTISNVTAHLAGALGKPTTLLLPFSCDWRWGLAESTTNWYESITILRQQSPGDWSYPLQQLVDLLG